MIPADGPATQRFILLRACQLAVSRELPVPDDACYREAEAWALPLLRSPDGYLHDEARAFRYLIGLEPKLPLVKAMHATCVP